MNKHLNSLLYLSVKKMVSNKNVVAPKHFGYDWLIYWIDMSLATNIVCYHN